MNQERQTPFQRALDVVEQLPFEDQATLIAIVRQRLIERRRAEIAEHAEAARLALQEGRVQYGTSDDLMSDLLNEP